MKNNNEIYAKGDIFVGIKQISEEYGELTIIPLYVGHDLLKCLKKLSRYSSGQKGEYLVLEQWRNGNKQSEYDLYYDFDRKQVNEIIREYRKINNASQYEQSKKTGNK